MITSSQNMMKKVKLYLIDPDTFVVYIELDDIYKDIAEDVEN